MRILVRLAAVRGPPRVRNAHRVHRMALCRILLEQVDAIAGGARTGVLGGDNRVVRICRSAVRWVAGSATWPYG